MKIFIDFHHGALLRWMFYLFADRLGHEVGLVGSGLCGEVSQIADPGTWGAMYEMGLTNIGITDAEKARCTYTFIESIEELQDTKWDAMVLTRTESQKLLRQLGYPNRNLEAKYVGVSGNEGSYYDWMWVKNVMASDLMTYKYTQGADVNKIHVPQELGRAYDQGFVPIKEENLHNIYAFLNNIRGYDQDIKVRNSVQRVNIYKLWTELQEAMPEYTFRCWGHGNEDIGSQCITENVLAPYYHEAAMVWHYKTYEGYGHALLQSLPAGRPVIVPRGFYDDRTAGAYLDDENAFFCGYDLESVRAAILENTASLETANRKARSTYDSYKKRFDWEHEARRVAEWVEAWK